MNDQRKEVIRKSINVAPVAVRLLSDKEAGAYLGISRSLIREYANRGKIRTVRLPHPSGIGYVNRLLFDVQDLDAFVENAKSTLSKRF